MSINLVLFVVALVLAVVGAIWQRASYPAVLVNVAVALVALGLILRPYAIG